MEQKLSDITDATHYGGQNRQQGGWWAAAAGSWDWCWSCWKGVCCCCFV